MGTEIERKFLVRDDAWRARAHAAQRMRQGYLVADVERSVRVRIAGDGALLTIKGRTRGATRAEYEVELPTGDAEEILAQLCLEPVLDKTRHHVEHAGHDWVVDEFHGEHEGLVLAEIELSAESESFALPDWAGEEVTGDPRYYNASLVRARSDDQR